MNRTEKRLADCGVRLLALPLPLPGFERFISSWLVETPEGAALIDCGPQGTVHHLINQMGRWNVEPRWLLLTHIHMDHAGAAGFLAKRYGDMKICCHGASSRHLVDPRRLTEATATTIGSELASLYETPLAVASDRFIDVAQLPSRWSAVETPGHAPHHVTFFYETQQERICFGGEALGTLTSDESWFTDGILRPWLRPATPPRTEPSMLLRSAGVIHHDRWTIFCTAHFGASDDGDLAKRAALQLKLWRGAVEDGRKRHLSDQQILDLLLLLDVELTSWPHLTAEVKQREQHFMLNSIKGLRLFLEEKESSNIRIGGETE